MEEQGTNEWKVKKLGFVGASRISDILAKPKSGSGESASRKNYKAEIIAQRLTGNLEPSFTTQAMQWGIDNEPIARAEYEVRNGVFVDQTGFVLHPSIEWSGASPDGLIGDDGLIEIKCPNTATHIDTLLSGKIPTQYQSQMLWQCACTGRAWCDFVSYDPRLPNHLAYFCKRYSPSMEEIKEAEQEVEKFLTEVQEVINKLRSKYGISQ